MLTLDLKLEELALRGIDTSLSETLLCVLAVKSPDPLLSWLLCFFSLSFSLLSSLPFLRAGSLAEEDFVLDLVLERILHTAEPLLSDFSDFGEDFFSGDGCFSDELLRFSLDELPCFSRDELLCFSSGDLLCFLLGELLCLSADELLCLSANELLCLSADKLLCFSPDELRLSLGVRSLDRLW